MSRTTLCLLTASLVAGGSVVLMLARHRALGDDVATPLGPEAWKITLIVHGRTTGDARLVTATPLPTDRQHVLDEHASSEALVARPMKTDHPGQRLMLWLPQPGAAPGPFEARYECFCSVQPARPAAAPEPLRHLYESPQEGQYLQPEPGIDSDHPDIVAAARQITPGKDAPGDVAEALFRYIDREVANVPTVAGMTVGALDCLRQERGDSAGKSRLLVALCRNRGIPARLVTGLTLTKQGEQSAHVWVEAWVREQWLAMCPFYHHFGHVPRTYLVFGYGDLKLVHGRNVRVRDYAFLVEQLPASAALHEGSWVRRTFVRLSPYALPAAERHLVEFLMLLPLGALVVCVFRNLVGVTTFGTFAPALLGLAFRELESLAGILIFVSILLVGWLMRRALGRLHLLQVPRTSVMLSLVVGLLCLFVVLAHQQHLSVTRYISLFPLVILTGMIERFWTLEEEDSTAASFRTLFYTVGVAACIGLVVSLKAVSTHFLRYPETLGLVIAAQLVLGRYTGYRLTELYRFREFLKDAAPVPVPQVVAVKARPEVGHPRLNGAE